MNVKNILFFIGGVVIGGAAGVLGSKKYFQDKYQKRYEEDRQALEEYYNRTDEYSRITHDEEYEDNDVNPTQTDSKPGGRMSPEERAEIKKRLSRNWEGTTDYASMYKVDKKEEEIKVISVDLAEKEHPLDQGEDGEEDPSDENKTCEKCKFFKSEEMRCSVWNESVNEEDSCSEFEPLEDYSLEEEVFDEQQKNKNKPPKIISAEAYSNLPAHIDQQLLYFYAYDEVLCDDNEEAVDEPELLIGDALTKYDFIDSDELVIFVMNYNLNTCYEIQKVNASWTDSH